MAGVVVYQGGVQQRPVARESQQAFTTDDGIGRGLQQAGQALGQFANAREQYQARVDEATAMDLDSAFGNDVREIESSFLSAQGRNAVDQAKAAEEAWGKTRDSYLGRVQNPRQRAMLGQVFQRREQRWNQQYTSHLTTQTEKWTTDAENARIGSLSVDMASLPIDSEERNDAALALGAQLDGMAQRRGWSAEVRREQGRLAFGKVHEQTVGALVEAGDPHKARDYLESNADQIDPAIRTRLRGVVREQVDNYDARSWAQGVDYGVSGAPVEASVDALWGALKTQESGNRQFDSRGQLITSRVGAFGIAQLMPDTAEYIARQMGDPSLAAKARTDPAVNERMGRWYLGKQLEKYGSASLALAAYNAGPGRVDRWLLTIGDPRTGQMTEAEWASRIPFQETRNYVQTIVQRSGGSGAMSAIIPEGQGIRLAREAAGDDPRRQAAFEAAFTGERRRVEADRRDVQSAARDAVQTYLPNGATPVQSWTDIPPRVWNGLDPEYQNQIRASFAANAAGAAKVETDQEIYGALIEMRALNPQRFARDIDLADYSDNLSESDLRSLTTAQLSIRARPDTPENNPRQAAVSSAWTQVKALAEQSGIKTGDKANDEDRRQLNGLQTYVRQEVEAWVASKGEVPSRDQVLAFAANGLRALEGRRGVLGIGREERYNFEVIVPPEAQRRIISEYRAVAGVNPDPDRIRELYMQGRANGEFR